MALVVGLLVAWQVSQVLLLVFAGVVVATILLSIADLFSHWTPLSQRWGLRLSILLLIALVGGVPLMFGVRVTGEFDNLVRSIPDLVDNAGQQLGIEDLSAQVNGVWSGAWQDGIFSSLAGYTSNAVGILTSVVLVLFGGIFLALDAPTYREGVLKLVPSPRRDNAREVMSEAGKALRLWLLGQLLAMVVVGGVTVAGLMLLGMPSALALGILAGLLEFIPFLGPILAYGVALLVALTVDFNMVIWVTALYVVLQQVESNILVPLIQKRTVEMPPALGLFALVAISSLFGPLGLLLGVPLTVVAIVAVKHLYIRDVLKEETRMPGDQDDDSVDV